MKEGDIGIEFLFTLKLKNGDLISLDDLTAATLYMQFTGSEDIKEKELEIVSAEDSTVRYVTIEDDLDNSGVLLLEIKLEFESGNVFRTKTMKVKVEDAISYPEIVEEDEEEP